MSVGRGQSGGDALVAACWREPPQKVCTYLAWLPLLTRCVLHAALLQLAQMGPTEAGAGMLGLGLPPAYPPAQQPGSMGSGLPLFQQQAAAPQDTQQQAAGKRCAPGHAAPAFAAGPCCARFRCSRAGSRACTWGVLVAFVAPRSLLLALEFLKHP